MLIADKICLVLIVLKVEIGESKLYQDDVKIMSKWCNKHANKISLTSAQGTMVWIWESLGQELMTDDNQNLMLN